MRLASIGFLSLFVLVGCGGGPDDMPELGDVSGTVTLGGKPLAGVLVEFKPTESGRPSTATTAEDGTYKLQYTADHPGAIIGDHTIIVHPKEEEEDYEAAAGNREPEDPLASFPPAASDGSLTMTVKAGENTKDIAL